MARVPSGCLFRSPGGDAVDDSDSDGVVSWEDEPSVLVGVLGSFSGVDGDVEVPVGGCRGKHGSVSASAVGIIGAACVFCAALRPIAARMSVSERLAVGDVSYLVNPSEEMLVAGADLVQHVSMATGFPDPSRWPEGSLVAHTRNRQAVALQVVVALSHPADGSSGPSVVGHALLLPAKRESWAEFGVVADFLEAGVLAELGATAVHPQMQRLGIASAMREIRLEEARRRGFVACVSVWDGGPSHLMYDGRPEWVYVGSSMAIYTQRLVHRYVEAAAL